MENGAVMPELLEVAEARFKVLPDGTWFEVVNEASHSDLLRALFAAQQEVQGIGKEGAVKGSDGKKMYSYTATEDMILNFKPVLARHGLMVDRAAQWIRDNEVVVIWMLTHVESMQTRYIPSSTPISGRERGKAAHGANTSALGYFYRDALQVARKEEFDTSGFAPPAQGASPDDARSYVSKRGQSSGEELRALWEIFCKFDQRFGLKPESTLKECWQRDDVMCEFARRAGWGE